MLLASFFALRIIFLDPGIFLKKDSFMSVHVSGLRSVCCCCSQLASGFENDSYFDVKQLHNSAKRKDICFGVCACMCGKFQSVTYVCMCVCWWWCWPVWVKVLVSVVGHKSGQNVFPTKCLSIPLHIPLPHPLFLCNPFTHSLHKIVSFLQPISPPIPI